MWTISRYSRDRLCQANAIDPQKVQILPCVVNGTTFTLAAKPPELVAKYGLEDAKVLMTKFSQEALPEKLQQLLDLR